MITEKESAHRLRRTFYFAESFNEAGGKGAYDMRHSFLYFVSLVHISRDFVRKVFVHLRTVYAKASATAVVYIVWGGLEAWKMCKVMTSHFATLLRSYN